jgi:hypothetical protein
MTLQPTWQLFFDRDPYADFNYTEYPDDLEGWGSTHPIFHTLIDAVRPRTIVEVGSWKGASAIHMAQTAGSLGLRPTVICIDTWLGTFESYAWPHTQNSLLPRNGWPLVYYQFLANVVRTGYGEQIVPLPQTSQIGLRLIRNSGIKPELIYVDASHDYIDVKQDLETSWECVAENGIIFGDDYQVWAGVTKAVDEFCISHNLILIGTAGKFALARQGNILALLGDKNLVQPDGSCGGLKVCRPSLL